MLDVSQVRVEWDKGRNNEQAWEQVKCAMLDSGREMCGSVGVRGKNPQNVWWNKVIKVAVKRKICMEGGFRSKG